MKQEFLLKCYETLVCSDLIKSGTTLQGDLLLTLFQIDDIDSMEYIGALISLRDFIEVNSGLFCTIKEKKNIFIKYPEDGRICSKRRKQKAFRILQNTLDTLLNTDLDDFDDEKERMKHLHETNIMIFINGKLMDNE